ncbi:unnamed protein product [Cunninghamella blakesleeana]
MALSEYEKTRLENIRRNQELLRDLEVPTGPIKLNNESTTQLKKHTPKLEKKKPTAPLRVSARLRGISAVHIEVDEKDKLLKRNISSNDDKDSVKKAKLQRIEELSDQEKASFLQLIGLTNSSKKEEEEEEEDQPVDPSLQPLQDQYSQLKIRHDWVNVKMSTDRITNCLFHPNKTKLLGIATSVAGHLSFWDIDNKEEETGDPVIYSYRPNTGSISYAKFPTNDSSKLYLSSYDGSIRVFDMNEAKFSDVSLSDHYPLTHFDFAENNQVIYFSTVDGEVGIHDTRSRKPDTVISLREKKIGCIHLNPVHENLLVAASNDRTATIWDIRHLKKEAAKPLQTFPHGYAVTSAFWSPDGNYLSTSCYDDFLRIFDVNKDTLELDLKKKIKHNCHTGKWVTMFRTVWNENKRFGYDHPHFVIGNMNHPISVFAAETGSKLIDLYDEDRITAVPGCNSVHPTLDKLAIISANASGKVVIWN